MPRPIQSCPGQYKLTPRVPALPDMSCLCICWMDMEEKECAWLVFVCELLHAQAQVHGSVLL